MTLKHSRTRGVARCGMIVLGLFCLTAVAQQERSPLLEAAPKPKPVEAPSQADIEKSIRRGVEFLLKRQNEDGSWGSANTPGRRTSMPPCPGPIRPFGRP